MKELHEIRHKALFDVRAEVVAAALLADDENLIPEQIIVAAKGHAQRRSHHEIKEIKKRIFDHDEVWQIEVNRKGLFDTLPERIFLRLDDDYPDALAKAKAIERQIGEARKFFLPFEQALFLPRIEIEQLEQKWTEGLPKFVEDLWGLRAFADCLTARQAFLLCYLMPEAHRIAGDWDLTKLCFEAVLRKTIVFNFIAPLEYEIPETNAPTDEIELGDLVLGESFRDDIPALEIAIEGISLAELPDCLPGGKRRKLLETLLYSYFLPLDVTVVTRIEVTEEAWGFTFGEAVLGYNVRLN
jgi:hypothetical protein